MIAKAPEGSKYEAAVGWNTTLVSLPWLYACEKERGELDKGRRQVYGSCTCALVGLHSHLSPPTDLHALLILSYHPFLLSYALCTAAVYVEPRKFPVKPPSHSPPPLRYNTCMSIYINIETHANEPPHIPTP